MRELSYITVQRGTQQSAVLMLLHGVGANEESIATLAAGADERLTVISVRAPLTIGPRAFAWFPVQFTAAGPVLDAESAEQGRLRLLEFIRLYKAEHHVDSVYLMGFSQGAIMAVVAALSEPELVQGAVGLSGRLPVEFLPVIAAPERLKATQFWIGHGIEDAKLPIHFARNVRERLASLKARFAYNEFGAGHVVTSEMLSQAHGWLHVAMEDPHLGG